MLLDFYLSYNLINTTDMNTFILFIYLLKFSDIKMVSELQTTHEYTQAILCLVKAIKSCVLIHEISIVSYIQSI